jgi:signal transduction histidine kinase
MISKLRRELLLYLGIATMSATFMSLTVSAWYSSRQLLIAQSEEVSLFAHRVGDHYGTLRQAMNELLATLVLINSPETRRLEMLRVIRSNIGIDSVAFLSRNTTSIESEDRSGYSSSLDRPGSECDKSNAWIIEASTSEISGEIFARFCVRSAGDGNYLLFGRLSLRRLSELLADMRVAGGARTAVSDGQRHILAHSDLLPALQRQPLKPTQAWSRHVLRFLSLGTTQTSPEFFAGGVRTSTSISNTTWTAEIERDLEQLFAPLGAVVATLAAASFVILGVAALLAARLAETFTRPVAGLSAMIREGRTMSAQLPLTSGVLEFDQLSQHFGDLTTRIEGYQQGLEKKIAEKTLDLATANERLEIISRHKSEFLAHMSHELRTPLNAVIGFSDLLKAQYFGPLNQKQSEYVRDINASGQHLLSLINDILDLAKVEAGRMELMLSDAHVGALVESCVALVSERINRSAQTLSVDVASDVSVWPLDERKVKQCLLNLLTNASKFTAAGGAIALRVWTENHALFVAVSDTGMGISADDMPKLFSEFYQAQAVPAGGVSDRVEQREGTGLGLALTKGFVELHGGAIGVTSVVGEGSTFTIRLPAAVGIGLEKSTTATEHVENPGAQQ